MKKEKKKNKYEKDLEIDRRFLDEELAKQPILYHKYGKLAERALEKFKSEEIELDRIQSKLHLRFKKLKISETKYKMTDKTIDAMIKKHKKYRKQAKIMLHAQRIYGYFKSAVKSFEQRNQMLIQISSNKRKEKEMINSLKKRKNEDE